MTQAVTSISTALGTFQFIATCSEPSNKVTLVLETFEPRLSLPPGMSVESVHAVVLKVKTLVHIAELKWICISPSCINGSGCNGQFLNAQEWEAEGRMVTIGTEDEEALASRLTLLKLDPDEYLGDRSAQKLGTNIPNIPASAAFSLHFIVAENPSPEPFSDSSWYAVEIPHENLVDVSGHLHTLV